jgi:hypothetical protein
MKDRKRGKPMNANLFLRKLAQAQPDGKLPAFAFPGGYPLYYVDAENNVLCPDCANENDEFSAQLVNWDINYEDAYFFCDHCSKQIESAYGEDND